MPAFLQILKTETLNPKSEEKQGDLEKSKQNVAKELRSNLPRLWLALAFHKIAPIVAVLLRYGSQPLQWHDARAVGASGHRH